MGEDHTVGRSLPDEGHDGRHSLVGGQQDVQPEAVHVEVGAVVDEPVQVVRLGGVTAEPDDDGAEVGALAAQDLLTGQTRLGLSVGVDGDRGAGPEVGLGHGARDSLDAGG